MLAPVISPVPPDRKSHVLTCFRYELGVGVTGNHASPEVSDALLQLSYMFDRVRPDIRAPLVWEYMDVVVDNHLRPSSHSVSSTGHENGSEDHAPGRPDMPPL